MHEGKQGFLQDEERYRLLIDAISDYAIYMLDPSGHIASWNAGAQRFKGYEAWEILGEHFSRFYTEEDKLGLLPERALEAASGQGRFENEGWRLRKDGTRFWAHVIIDAIRDEQGSLIGFAKITRDITEKRETQRALLLAREELFQSQKMEAIGQLTGGIAHDFNNLLMAVLGSLEILRKRMPEDPALMPLIDNAIQGAERGAALTQRLLAFSRRQELNMSPVALPALVDGMMDFLQRSLGSAIRIETAMPARLPLALTDPVQLETALLNLVVNARDAMTSEGRTSEGRPSEGRASETGRLSGGTITVSAAERQIDTASGTLKPGHYVCLSVTDTGEGMDAETLARATTPFFTTKGVGKGTGLGLPMVQGLTEQSGGALTIDSEKGRGTTVSVILPVADLEDCPENRQPVPSAPLRTPAKTLSVLAVDDDALVLMNTALMLEDLGHTVLEAHSGIEALDLLERGAAIDLVITDHSMPRMTGSELAARLRQQRPALPVILATGYAELPPGGDARLPRLAKPFSQAQLQDAIVAVLAGAG